MRKEDFAESFGDINEKHILGARAEHKAKKPVWVKWGAIAACLFLAAVCVWHSNAGTPTLPPTVGEQVNTVDRPNNTTDTNIETTISNEGKGDTIIWLSADEVLKSAENNTQYMGVAVPILIAYQGAIYGRSGEEDPENSQYARLETEVILRKIYSYPAYQIRDDSDSVAILINGRLTTYQKLFDIDAVIAGASYKVVYSMGLGIEYTYGEVVQESEDFTVYQAIDKQSGEVLESEYVINILPLLKKELPNFFGGDENYGEAWWVAVPCSID